MSHYNKLEMNLKDKLGFIERLKDERNKAQDYIEKVQAMAQVSTKEELEKFRRVVKLNETLIK
jgi:hypothetical protein